MKTLRITRAGNMQDTLIKDFQTQGDLTRRFTVATNSFLLSGGDGYQAFKSASESRGGLKTGAGEQQILIDYIQKALKGSVDLPEPLDFPRVVRIDQ